MTLLRLAKRTGFLVLLCLPCFASEVIKPSVDGKMAAISQNRAEPWRPKDYACVLHGEREVACGTIVKTTRIGAIVRFDYVSKEGVLPGDRVEPYEMPADVAAAEAARAKAQAQAKAQAEAEAQAQNESKSQSQSQAVDLAHMDDSPGGTAKSGKQVSQTPISDESKSSEPAMGPHGLGFTKPHFKIFYDFMLTYQPGYPAAAGPPLTFDTYHQLLLLEIFPDPNTYFGFEVSPNPRFFELDYVLKKWLTLRVGRIYIPFDDLSPHSFFGGRANVAKLVPPGGTPFLPDIWADLGIGLKFRLANSPMLKADFHLYVVNGFSDAGATDPLGKSPVYPNFGTIPQTDNNNDKAIGTRLAIKTLKDHLRLGVSFYRNGQYSSQNEPYAGLWMFGMDGQLYLGTTELRAGYVYMNIGFPNNIPGFVRAGYYIELGQTIMNKWTIRIRGGQVQNDDRVVQATDETNFGGGIFYKPGLVQLSFEYNHDFNVVGLPSTAQFPKTNYDYYALRVVMAF